MGNERYPNGKHKIDFHAVLILFSGERGEVNLLLPPSISRYILGKMPLSEPKAMVA